MEKVKEQIRKWQTQDVDTLSLLLDRQNPRIDGHPKISQSELRKLLLDTEEIIQIAEGILKSRGLMAGERIIICYEGDNAIVLEGNRRVCACQLLLNQRLIPSEYKNSFPKTNDQEIRDAISKLKADVAPSREEAEPVITRRHTQPGIKQWSPLANQRRIIRLIEKGNSVEDIQEKLGVNRSFVKRIIKDNKLLAKIRSLKGWNKKEIQALSSPGLKVNPFTRFFTLAGAKEYGGISFDSNGEIISMLSEDNFEELLEGLARALLLPQGSSKKALFDTRATPEKVYDHVFDSKPHLKSAIALVRRKQHKKERASNGRTKISAKAAKYFENLVCTVPDDRLRQLTNEIRNVDPKKLPTAATFLIRALIESCLDYSLRRQNKIQDMKREFHAKPKNHGHDPGLEFIIRFCKNNSKDIFSEKFDRILNQWLSNGHKDWADLIIHGKWIMPTETTIHNAASVVRPLIQKILTDECFNTSEKG